MLNKPSKSDGVKEEEEVSPGDYDDSVAKADTTLPLHPFSEFLWKRWEHQKNTMIPDRAGVG